MFLIVKKEFSAQDYEQFLEVQGIYRNVNEANRVLFDLQKNYVVSCWRQEGHNQGMTGDPKEDYYVCHVEFGILNITSKTKL